MLGCFVSDIEERMSAHELMGWAALSALRSRETEDKERARRMMAHAEQIRKTGR